MWSAHRAFCVCGPSVKPALGQCHWRVGGAKTLVLTEVPLRVHRCRPVQNLHKECATTALHNKQSALTSVSQVGPFALYLPAIAPTKCLTNLWLIGSSLLFGRLQGQHTGQSIKWTLVKNNARLHRALPKQHHRRQFYMRELSTRLEQRERVDNMIIIKEIEIAVA